VFKLCPGEKKVIRSCPALHIDNLADAVGKCHHCKIYELRVCGRRVSNPVIAAHRNVVAWVWCPSSVTKNAGPHWSRFPFSEPPLPQNSDINRPTSMSTSLRSYPFPARYITREALSASANLQDTLVANRLCQADGLSDPSGIPRYIGRTRDRKHKDIGEPRRHTLKLS
jgi:hypothetical protein